MTNTQTLIENAHKRAIKRLGLDIKHFSCVKDGDTIISKIRNTDMTITTRRAAFGKYTHSTAQF